MILDELIDVWLLDISIETQHQPPPAPHHLTQIWCLVSDGPDITHRAPRLETGVTITDTTYQYPNISS